jgi:hypothetical protein
VLHYVPVMQVNTHLLWVNPILASGFTIFSLIYSVIAEFFGTKAPTVEELRAKKKYLEETSGVLEAIRKLEEKNKGTSLLDRVKKGALEVKSNTIVTLRNKGTLKTAALNRTLITVASLKAYDLKRSKRKQAQRIQETKPTYTSSIRRLNQSGSVSL